MTPIHLIGDYYAVEVPDKVQNMNLYRVNNYANMLEWDDVERPLNPHTCIKIDKHYGDLKDYKWPQIICTTREVTRMQASEIVGSSDWFLPVRHVRYIDYAHPWDQGDNKQAWSIGFGDPLDSLRSLLTSKGLDVNKNYLIIKKVS